jgi:hypothetical protein
VLDTLKATAVTISVVLFLGTLTFLVPILILAVTNAVVVIIVFLIVKDHITSKP